MNIYNYITTIIIFCFLNVYSVFADMQDNSIEQISNYDTTIFGKCSLQEKGCQVEIIEYSSLSCPACANFYKKYAAPVKEEYKHKEDKIIWVRRDVVESRSGLIAAKFLHCIPKEYYNKMIDFLYQYQVGWSFSNTEKKLKNLGLIIGMSEIEFDHCMDNKSLEEELIKKSSIINVVPTIIYNGKKISHRDLHSFVAKDLD